MPDFEFEFTPGMVERGNIDLYGRPVVQNPDGSISTLRSFSAGFDDKHYLLPLVGDKGEDLTHEQAIELFRRSGQHLGAFSTPESATEYAKRISAESGRWYRGAR
jgi:hypothetical protein